MRRKETWVEYDEPRVDGVSVVTLDGRIVPGDESNALREKLKVSLAKMTINF